MFSSLLRASKFRGENIFGVPFCFIDDCDRRATLCRTIIDSQLYMMIFNIPSCPSCPYPCFKIKTWVWADLNKSLVLSLCGHFLDFKSWTNDCSKQCATSLELFMSFCLLHISKQLKNRKSRIVKWHLKIGAHVRVPFVQDAQPYPCTVEAVTNWCCTIAPTSIQNRQVESSTADFILRRFFPVTVRDPRKYLSWLSTKTLRFINNTFTTTKHRYFIPRVIWA